MEIVQEVPNAPKPVGPYSVAVKAGGLLFCSGQIGLDPDKGVIVEGGVEAQARQVLDNLKAVLIAAGSSFDKVVMTSIFLSTMSDFKSINEIYAEYVSADKPPARQTVAVKELPLGALVEISVIAEV